MSGCMFWLASCGDDDEPIIDPPVDNELIITEMKPGQPVLLIMSMVVLV